MRQTIVAVALGLLLNTPLGAQNTPLVAFRGNIAAIHSRNRAAYLSHYLHTAALAQRRLEHELPRRVRPASARPEPVDGQRDRIGEVAGVAGPAAGDTGDRAPQTLGGGGQ